jgi:hypothetical protein
MFVYFGTFCRREQAWAKEGIKKPLDGAKAAPGQIERSDKEREKEGLHKRKDGRKQRPDLKSVPRPRMETWERFDKGVHMCVRSFGTFKFFVNRPQWSYRKEAFSLFFRYTRLEVVK